MYENSRPATPVGATTLPSRYYADPGYFREELEFVHRDMWLHAGRVEELDAPGRYFLREIGDESLLVLRDGEGALRAFHNVCRHRGTRLCVEPEGRLAGRVQCPYHAWTYGLDGVLVNAPHMDKVEGFRPGDYPLRSLAVDAWDGHVFVHLGEKPAPLSEHLDDLPELFRPWRMSELRRVERRVYDLAANWKLVIQNYSECLHCPIVHPLLNKLSHYMSGDNAPPRPTYLGGRMDLREGVASLTMDGTTRRAALPGLSDDDRRHVYYYAVLPNLLLNLHPDYMLTFTLWPLAVDRTRIVCEWHFHPDQIAGDGFDATDAVEFWDLTNRQDWELSERAQQGIRSRGYLPGPYSNREELLHALDRLVLAREQAWRASRSR